MKEGARLLPQRGRGRQISANLRPAGATKGDLVPKLKRKKGLYKYELFSNHRYPQEHPGKLAKQDSWGWGWGTDQLFEPCDTGGREKLPGFLGGAWFSAFFRSPPTQWITSCNLNFCTDFHTRVRMKHQGLDVHFPVCAPAMHKQRNHPVSMPS